MTRPILVFGAGGRVGGALRRQIRGVETEFLPDPLATSDKVPAVIRDFGGQPWVFLDAKDCDIRDGARLARIVGYGAEAIINLAACTLPKAERESCSYEAEEVNADAVGKMAELGIPMLHISTDCVFSGEKAEPYTEEDGPQPCNWYGVTKRMGELALESARIPHIVLRTTGVYLSGRHNFFETVLTKARAGEPLEIVTDTLFTPTDARELAKAILMATERLIEDPSVSGTYHFAGPDVMSYMDFAELVLDEAGLSHPLKSVTQADREKIEGFKRPKNAALNSDKFAAVFSYRHRPTRECVKEVVSAALA